MPFEPTANHCSSAGLCLASREKNLLIISEQQKHGSAIPPRWRGRCGQSSPNVRRGMRWTRRSRQRALADGEVVWSWPADAEAKSARSLADDGSKKARLPGRKPSRRDAKGCSAKPVVTAASFYAAKTGRSRQVSARPRWARTRTCRAVLAIVRSSSGT